MPITTLNSQAIPADVIQSSDLDYPLTDFSSTGIDDNATSTAITIDSSENVGIGTASPASLLELEGADPIITLDDTSAGGYAQVQALNGSLILMADEGASVSNSIVRFDVDGTERMRIDSSGSVGIGTTSPNYPLHLNKSDSAGCWAQFTNSTTGTGSAAGTLVGIDSNEDFRILQYEAKAIEFSTSATERMRIDSSGNVGIGTTSPSYKLTVGGNSNSANNVLTGSNIVVGTTIGIRERGNTAGVGGNVYASQIYQGNSGGGDLEIYNVSPTYSLVFGTNTTERMRIDSAGNVGIGTTSPDGKLNVFSASAGSVSADADADELVLENSGNVGLSLLTASTGESGIYFGNPGTNGQKDFYLKYYHESHATTANRRAFTFNTASTERMRIDSSGNVQIGTAAVTGGRYFDIYNTGSTATDFAITRFITQQVGSSSTTSADIIKRKNGQFGIINNDTDSAAYINFTVGASERMRIDSSGRLLLNTTDATTGGLNPTVNFKQLSNAAYHRGMIIESSDSDAYIGIGYSGSEFQIGASYRASAGYKPVTFVTGGYERMRLDSSGNLLVGTSSLGGNSGRFHAVRSNTGAIGYFEVNNGSGVQNAVDITNAANAAFSPLRFWVNGYGTGSLVGSISCTTSGTAFNATSDVRVKENIVDAPAGNIDAIRVRSFDWKADGTHQPYGMIAQELVEVAPEAVSQGQTEDDMWGVDYSKLVPMMIKEIQDLKAEVAALKGE